MYFNSEEILTLKVLLDNQIKVNNKDIREAQNKISDDYFKMLNSQLVEGLQAQNKILENIIKKLNK